MVNKYGIYEDFLLKVIDIMPEGQYIYVVKVMLVKVFINFY